MVMGEIHLGKILAENRRRRGVTQDELAEFMGVSKAAVSKWETGASYPDILLLPGLASYFDISIDDLMGYEPQMDEEGISKVYRALAEEFTVLPFDEVMEHCRSYIRKYYSCYRLLLQMAVLFVNHFMLAGSEEKAGQVYEEAMELFCRVKEGAAEEYVRRDARFMEAYCLLNLGRPEEVLELLEEEPMGAGPSETLLASAWQMKGNEKESKRVLQTALYKNIVAFMNLMASYTRLELADKEKYGESCKRTMAVADAFHLETLHPTLLMTALVEMAQGWMALGEREKALEALRRYTDLALGDIYPLRLKGDGYFDLLDEWMEKNRKLDVSPPRDETAIRRSIVQALTENPAFAVLADDVRFREMAERLKSSEKQEGKPCRRSY